MRYLRQLSLRIIVHNSTRPIADGPSIKLPSIEVKVVSYLHEQVASVNALRPGLPIGGRGLDSVAGGTLRVVTRRLQRVHLRAMTERAAATPDAGSADDEGSC